MRWNQSCPINIRVTLNIFSNLKPSCYWHVSLTESVTVLFDKAVNLSFSVLAVRGNTLSNTYYVHVLVDDDYCDTLSLHYQQNFTFLMMFLTSWAKNDINLCWEWLTSIQSYSVVTSSCVRHRAHDWLQQQLIVLWCVRWDLGIY